MSMEPVFAALFAVLLGGEAATVADAGRRRDGARPRCSSSSSCPRRHDRGRGPAHRRLRLRPTSRIVDAGPTRRTSAATLLSCSRRGPILRATRPGHPSGSPARSSPHTNQRPWPSGRGVSRGAPAGPVARQGHHTARGTPWSSSWHPRPPTRTIARVVEQVESVGGEAFVSKGVVRTIIGLVGDIDSFHGLNLRSMPGVADVHRISDPYKLVSRQHHPDRSTVWVGPRATRCRSARTRSRSSPARAPSSRRSRPSRPPRWPRPPARRCCAAARSSRAPRRTPSRASASPGLEILADGARGDRPADRHRGGRRPRRAGGRRARRHAPGRHPQHGQLRAAPGRRRVPASRCCSSAA